MTHTVFSICNAVKSKAFWLSFVMMIIINNHAKAQCTDTILEICKGEQVKLEVEAGITTGIQWYKNGKALANAIAGATNPSLTVSQEGTYYYTVNNVTGCINGSCCGVKVVIVDLSTLTANSTFSCLSQNGQLNSSSIISPLSVTYKWAGPNSFNSNVQNPLVSNVTTNSVYTVTASTSNLCSATATTSLNVTSCVNTCTNTIMEICKGEHVKLEVETGITTGIQWYKNGKTPVNAIAGAINPILLVNEAGIYYYKVTKSGTACVDESCCGVEVVVVDLSTLTVSNNSPFCGQGNAQLGANVTGSPLSVIYKWAGPNNFSSSLQNPLVSNLTSSGIYTVTASTSNLCSATATTNVIIKPKPTIIVSNQQCNGNTTYNLVATVSNGAALVANVGVVAGTSPNFTVSNIPVGTAVELKATLDACTTSLLENSPTCGACLVTATALPNRICEGEQLVLNTSTGTAYKWAGTGTFSSTTTQNPTITALMAGNYTFSVTVSVNASCTATATTSVLVKAKPVFTNILTSCNKNTFTYNLTGTVTSGSAIFANVGTLSQPDATGLFTLTNITAGVAVTITANSNGCLAEQTIQSPNCVNCTLLSVTTNSNGNVCPTGTINLTATANGFTGTVNYTWAGINFTSAVQNPIIYNATTAQSGIYTVTADNGICTATGTTTVSVSNYAIPTATATAIIATCNDSNTANQDAKIVISGFSNTDRCDYTIGNTYTGTATYSSATAIPASGIIVGTLPNPITATRYTARIFSNSGCFVDRVILLDPKDCSCKPLNCMPFEVKKSKNKTS